MHKTLIKLMNTLREQSAAHLRPNGATRPGVLQYRKPFISCFLLLSSKSSELSGPVSLVQPFIARVLFSSGLSFSFITCAPSAMCGKVQHDAQRLA